MFNGKNRAMNKEIPIGDFSMVIPIAVAVTAAIKTTSKPLNKCVKLNPKRIEAKTIGKISPPTQPVFKQISRNTNFKITNPTKNKKEYWKYAHSL